MPINQQEWDARQIKNGASFLQSADWGEFQAKRGSRAHLLEGPSWSALLLEKKTALGKYLFSPYGPTLDNPAALDEALKSMKAFGKSAGFAWLRLEPVATSGDLDELKNNLLAAGAHPAPRNVEPPLTRVIDLQPSSEELLASISATTRSIIRKNISSAEITFKTSEDPADIELFSSMLESVAKRNRVNFFPRDYFKDQAEVLMPRGMMYLELAYDGNEPVGSIVMHRFGPTSSYTYAASVPEARDKNVSALLMWQAIVNARQKGLKLLDLYGIAPEEASPSHPWHGFSAFKRKFGGRVIEYAGTWDLALSGSYKLYRGLRRAKKIMTRT